MSICFYYSTVFQCIIVLRLKNTFLPICFLIKSVKLYCCSEFYLAFFGSLKHYPTYTVPYDELWQKLLFEIYFVPDESRVIAQ